MEDDVGTSKMFSTILMAKMNSQDMEFIRCPDCGAALAHRRLNPNGIRLGSGDRIETGLWVCANAGNGCFFPLMECNFAAFVTYQSAEDVRANYLHLPTIVRDGDRLAALTAVEALVSRLHDSESPRLDTPDERDSVRVSLGTPPPALAALPHIDPSDSDVVDDLLLELGASPFTAAVAADASGGAELSAPPLPYPLSTTAPDSAVPLERTTAAPTPARASVCVEAADCADVRRPPAESPPADASVPEVRPADIAALSVDVVQQLGRSYWQSLHNCFDDVSVEFGRGVAVVVVPSASVSGESSQKRSPIPGDTAATAGDASVPSEHCFEKAPSPPLPCRSNARQVFGLPRASAVKAPPADSLPLAAQEVMQPVTASASSPVGDCPSACVGVDVATADDELLEAMRRRLCDHVQSTEKFGYERGRRPRGRPLKRIVERSAANGEVLLAAKRLPRRHLDTNPQVQACREKLLRDISERSGQSAERDASEDQLTSLRRKKPGMPTEFDRLCVRQSAAASSSSPSSRPASGARQQRFGGFLDELTAAFPLSRQEAPAIGAVSSISTATSDGSFTAAEPGDAALGELILRKMGDVATEKVQRQHAPMEWLATDCHRQGASVLSTADVRPLMAPLDLSPANYFEPQSAAFADQALSFAPHTASNQHDLFNLNDDDHSPFELYDL